MSSYRGCGTRDRCEIRKLTSKVRDCGGGGEMC